MSDLSSGNSVTQWIEVLKRGEPGAAEKLWQRYFSQLIPKVRAKLGNANRAISDEEDIVAATFRDLFMQAQEGKFPRLFDRSDLWQLLVTISDRKVSNKRRDDGRKKRLPHQRNVLHQQTATDDSWAGGIEQFANSEPTPEFCAIMGESCQELLNRLDEKHLPVALDKLRSFTNPEIAKRHDCSVATVERRLARIRSLWEDAFGSDEDEAHDDAQTA